MEPQPTLLPAPVQTPPAPISHPHKRLTILAVILTLLFLTVMGLLAYQATQPTKQVPPPDPDIRPTSPPTPNETTEWKTYRNDEYGFEIKYPASATVITEFELFKVYVGGEEYPFGSAVAVDVLKNPDNLPLAEVGNRKYATDAPEPYDLGWRETTFMNLPALTTKYSPPGDGGTQIINLLNYKNTIYSIWSSPVDKPNSTTFSDLSNQILSTFRFVEEKTNNFNVWYSLNGDSHNFYVVFDKKTTENYKRLEVINPENNTVLGNFELVQNRDTIICPQLYFENNSVFWTGNKVSAAQLSNLNTILNVQKEHLFQVHSNNETIPAVKSLISIGVCSSGTY